MIVECSTSHAGRGVAVVSLAGDIDAYNAPNVRGALRAAMTDPNTKRIQVDLTEVSYLDSSGIGALIQCLAEAEARGVSLVVVGAQPQPRRVLRILGLADLFGLTAISETGTD